MAIKTYFRTFPVIERWMTGKLARAPVPGDKCTAVKACQGAYYPIPATTITMTDPDTFVVQYGEAPLVTHARNGTVVIHKMPTDHSTLLERIKQFTPFHAKSRSREARHYTVSLPPNFGIHQPQTYFCNSYDKGWVLKDGLTLRPTADGHWEVLGSTIQKWVRRDQAQRNMEMYCANYLRYLLAYDVKGKCPYCDIEADGKPMADIVERHWDEHINRWTYPRSLVCRVVYGIKDLEARKRLARVVDRAFGPPPKDPVRPWHIPTIQIPHVDHQLLYDGLRAYLSTRVLGVE